MEDIKKAAAPKPARVVTNDQKAVALWRQRHKLRQPLLDAYEARREAIARLPAWAAPGGKYWGRDNRYCGEMSFEPAFEERPQWATERGGGDPPKAVENKLARPDEKSLKENHDFALCMWPPKPEVAQATLDRELEALAARRKKQRVLEKEHGVTAARKVVDRLLARVKRIEDEIWSMRPGHDSPNVTAAVLMLGIVALGRAAYPVEQRETWSARLGLMYLLPKLNGTIWLHANELIEYPRRILGDCQFNLQEFERKPEPESKVVSLAA